MKILVFGSAGQLGTELLKVLNHTHQVLGVDLPEADITKLDDVLTVTVNFKADLIINAAAYTDVDGCELNPDKAFLVNAIGARNVAIGANKNGAKLIHISTDYVFDGETKNYYKDYDEPNPINIYGISKLQGEEFVKNLTDKYVILRVAWLYGRQGKNFIKTLLSLLKNQKELRIVNDQWGTPTSAYNVVKQIEKIMDTDLYGIYNCTCQGGCTWLEYSLEILRLIGYEVINRNDDKIELETGEAQKDKIIIKPAKMTEFPRPARRPKYCILDNYYLRLQGIDVMLPWQDALKEFFEELKKKGDIYEGLGFSRR